MNLSIVIPVYNEEENILPLYQALSEVLKNTKKKYEIIFIDDGSKDNSFHFLVEVAKKDKRVVVIKLRKNFGQTAALSAGFENASGSTIITMDGDMQNDPRDIPKLLEKINEGYDVVSGWRYERNDPLSKKIPSGVASWLRRKITNDEIHDAGCSLKAYRKECFKDIVLYGEMHRFIPTLLRWRGFKVTEVKVNHLPRKHGKTKYGIGRIMRGFLDLINAKFWMDFSTRPIHFFGKAGFYFIFIGILSFIYNLIRYKSNVLVGPTLILGVLFVIVGIQFVLFGFLSEIQVRSYFSENKKRVYSIDKKINKR